ncbi:conserved exported hypothetical protein [Nitrospina gracilis 3/211]|uniref:Lipoprotein n=1 Tax=Nitrospina gracilis (strain 3/211) TaxID=1266370 RepID=M1Z0M9_NITG3|nr:MULTISPECIES: hypothetical protein [Nitrospina]MCF8724124.1 hypothetical protein [Nitrospina sp. Nb-3]CCQ91270.1 conserved exported hypothetical protein [Nitrospina gracilis 3/211]
MPSASSPKPFKQICTLIITTFLVSTLSACANLGANRIEGERSNYNVAIQRTNDQQLLLNLVRLKYRDTPYFLEVSSVAAQFTLTTSANASASVPEGALSTFGFGAGAQMQEKPTITYSPLQGDKFIQRVLSPISMQTITLLYHSGWRVDRLFRLCFQRMNRIKNAPGASGPTPGRSPEFETFTRMASILRTFQKNDMMELQYSEENDVPMIIIKLDEDARETEDARLLAELLEVSPVQGRYYLTAVDDPRYIRVQTRSLLGVMYYLSQGVEVPPDHVDEGKVTVTYNDDGSRFDWQRLTGTLLRVRHGEDFDPNAFAVAILHRGTWFYIDDSDLNSKSTFSLLSQIFSLQAGKVPSSAPLLTLPIGQ